MFFLQGQSIVLFVIFAVASSHFLLDYQDFEQSDQPKKNNERATPLKVCRMKINHRQLMINTLCNNSSHKEFGDDDSTDYIYVKRLRCETYTNEELPEIPMGCRRIINNKRYLDGYPDRKNSLDWL